MTEICHAFITSCPSTWLTATKSRKLAWGKLLVNSTLHEIWETRHHVGVITSFRENPKFTGPSTSIFYLPQLMTPLWKPANFKEGWSNGYLAVLHMRLQPTWAVLAHCSITETFKAICAFESARHEVCSSDGCSAATHCNCSGLHNASLGRGEGDGIREESEELVARVLSSSSTRGYALHAVHSDNIDSCLHSDDSRHSVWFVPRVHPAHSVVSSACRRILATDQSLLFPKIGVMRCKLLDSRTELKMLSMSSSSAQSRCFVSCLRLGSCCLWSQLSM